MGHGLATLACCFAVIPAVVYAISYSAFFVQHGFAIRDFITLQSEMLHYQEGHSIIQPENSAAWSWPLLLHPVRYLNEVVDGSRSVIVALGNPALWWGSLVLLPVGLVQAARRPSWQHAIIFGGFAAMWLPWFLVGRTQFIWYMLPAVPFMCLIVASTLRGMPANKGGAVAMALGALTAVIATLFIPVWIGSSVSGRWIGWLHWLPGWPI